MEAFGLDALLVIDLVNRDQPVPAALDGMANKLLDQGIIERVGHGRGMRWLLCRQFYRHIGKAGVYTRKRGLDRETNKELLMRHIQDNQKEGSKLCELTQVLPALTTRQVQRLITELKDECQIRRVGTTRYARWYPVNY